MHEFSQLLLDAAKDSLFECRSTRSCPDRVGQSPAIKIAPENTPENTIFINNVLTLPKFDSKTSQKSLFLSKFLPPTAALRKEEYRTFHNHLIRAGRPDLSYKIDSCALDGMRLDCDDIISHDGYIPVFCKRRVCPSCALSDMVKRVEKYKPVSVFNSPEKEGPNRLRFWSFTQSAVKGFPLRKKAEAISKALHLYWRRVYGDKSPLSADKSIGGLLVIEVGAGWNIHAHALIYGPYHANLNHLRKVWRESLEYSGSSGDRIHVEEITRTDEALIEVISYPLNPKKNSKLSEDLLAEVELAFSGRHSNDTRESIPSIRRYIEKGSFYHHFQTPFHNPQICPFCAADIHISPMSWDEGFDSFKGRRFQKDFFNSECRWEDRIRGNYTIENQFNLMKKIQEDLKNSFK